MGQPRLGTLFGSNQLHYERAHLFYWTRHTEPQLDANLCGTTGAEQATDLYDIVVVTTHGLRSRKHGSLVYYWKLLRKSSFPVPCIPPRLSGTAAFLFYPIVLGFLTTTVVLIFFLRGLSPTLNMLEEASRSVLYSSVWVLCPVSRLLAWPFYWKEILEYNTEAARRLDFSVWGNDYS